MAKLNSNTRPNKRGPMPPRRRSKARHVPAVIRLSKRGTVSHAEGIPYTVDLVENAAGASMVDRGLGVIGAALAAAWVLTVSVATPPAVAAPLRLVTDQWIPYENLSDADAPGFSTEVLTGVFVSMKQEVSFEEFPWARAARLVFRGERDALFTAFYDEERARYCHFPKEALARDKWIFFVRVADAGRLKFSSFTDSRRPRDRRAARRIDLPGVLGLRAAAAHGSRDGERRGQHAYARSRPGRLRGGELRQRHAADKITGPRGQDRTAAVAQSQGGRPVRDLQRGARVAGVCRDLFRGVASIQADRGVPGDLAQVLPGRRRKPEPVTTGPCAFCRGVQFMRNVRPAPIIKRPT